MIQVRALTKAEEFERFADFGQEVYHDNPYWQAPHREHHIAEASGQVPQAVHCQIQSFWAERGGEPAAVVTAVIDRLYLERWGEPLGHLLLFEALPEANDEAAALLGEACRWLEEKGCRSARIGLLPGWQMPVTIDAYNRVPTVFHGYNPPYYHSYFKNAGFRTEQGCVEYRVRFTPELAARYREMTARAEASGARLRSWDFSKLEDETTLFTNLCNDTFARHWGFPSFTRELMAGLSIGMAPMLVPEFCVFAEVGGEPAGFVYALPDLNQAKPDHGVLLIIGVRQAYRGRGINLGMAARSYLAMIERGYKSASYTVVLDDNWPSRRTAEKLGCRVERNFVVYRRDFDVPDPADRR
jgi:hypothetical protein